MNPLEYMDELAAALKTKFKRVYSTSDVSVDTPAIVIGPPGLTYTVQGYVPTTVTFVVSIVRSESDTLLSDLLDDIETAGEAIEDLTEGSVMQALPGVYKANNGDFPCYQLTVEF
jgi:hypothetical protein